MLKKICMVLFLLLAILVISAYAQNDPAEKLEQGVEQAATGWTEVPKQMAETTEETNVIEGVTVGTVQGAGEAVQQTTEGAVNAATFYIPGEDNPEEIDKEDVQETIKEGEQELE